MRLNQKGSALVIILSVVSVVLLAVVGYVAYRSFIASKEPSPAEQTTATEPVDTSSSGHRITESDGALGKKYTNYDYGFEFSFPAKTIQPMTCDVSYTWKDARGNDIPAPKHYVSADEPSEMTVITDANSMTLVQKTAPFYTTANHPNGGTYNTSCEVRDVKVGDIIANAPLETRKWEVARAKTKDAIGNAIASLPTFKTAKTAFVLSELDPKTKRHDLAITYTDREATSPGNYKAWYYPDKELVVYIGLGQAPAFRDESDPTKTHMDDIVMSFGIID